MNQNALQLAIRGVMPMVRATGLLQSLATFSEPTGATGDDPAGALDDEGFPLGDYADIDGLVAIPCMLAPLSESKISSEEKKGLEELEATAVKHLELDHYYPAAVSGWRAGWRVTVDGIVYDVMGVEPSSQLADADMTRCMVRRVTQ